MMAKSKRICSVEGCGKPTVGRGFCEKHYRRMMRRGTLYLERREPQPKDGLCAVDGCDIPVSCAGHCRNHYYRLKTYGDPLGGKSLVTEEMAMTWLREHMDYYSTDCLTWPFKRTPKGYAVLSKKRAKVVASREMCRLAHGDPPTPEHEAAHSCGRGHEACVNPNHLRWASRSENMMDKNTHGTMLVGMAHHLTSLSEDDVRKIRSLPSSVSQQAVADQFGVSQTTVHNIRARKNMGLAGLDHDPDIYSPGEGL